METVDKEFLKQIVGKITLPKLVDSIRQGEEWSKGQMADKLEVSQSYYSDFLRGEKIPSIKKASRWAEILGYSQMRFVELAVNDYLIKIGLDIKVKAS